MTADERRGPGVDGGGDDDDSCDCDTTCSDCTSCSGSSSSADDAGNGDDELAADPPSPIPPAQPSEPSRAIIDDLTNLWIGHNLTSAAIKDILTIMAKYVRDPLPSFHSLNSAKLRLPHPAISNTGPSSSSCYRVQEVLQHLHSHFADLHCPPVASGPPHTGAETESLSEFWYGREYQKCWHQFLHDFPLAAPSRWAPFLLFIDDTGINNGIHWSADS